LDIRLDSENFNSYFFGMKRKTKGALTKHNIIEESRRILNEKGHALTLQELASEMDSSIGRITNYFPTKEHLFVALSEDYEHQKAELARTYKWDGSFSFVQLADYLHQVMKLQYKHRSLLLFVSSIGLQQRIMLRQISAKWRKNQTRVNDLVNTMVKANLLNHNSQP